MKLATVALLAVLALAAIVTAAASVTIAHNVGQLCAEHVTSWPGQGAPCW